MQTGIQAENRLHATAEVLRFGLLLVTVQAARALVAWPFWSLVSLKDAYLQGQVVSSLSFLVVGFVLWALARPTAPELGLSWAVATRRERRAYAAAGLVLLGLVASSISFGLGLFLENVHAAILVPAF